MRLDYNTKLILQEGRCFEHCDRIENSSGHQWRTVSQSRGVFSGQELVKEVSFKHCFNVLFVHSDGLDLRSKATCLWIGLRRRNARGCMLKKWEKTFVQ